MGAKRKIEKESIKKNTRRLESRGKKETKENSARKKKRNQEKQDKTKKKQKKDNKGKYKQGNRSKKEVEHKVRRIYLVGEKGQTRTGRKQVQKEKLSWERQWARNSGQGYQYE
eukprot:TRINITY_DN53586_c0_g1_i1.p5 TRINITY_DN53586_c0_g1~~TRINITY_DN53586_c0_g1_i1.p5  ORF type:complete len:113 (-),score=14.44 TRINITY_DN53586_c0_g1_i1:129-467(-)